MFTLNSQWTRSRALLWPVLVHLSEDTLSSKVMHWPLLIFGPTSCQKRKGGTCNMASTLCSLFALYLGEELNNESETPGLNLHLNHTS